MRKLVETVHNREGVEIGKVEQSGSTYIFTHKTPDMIEARVHVSKDYLGIRRAVRNAGGFHVKGWGAGGHD